MSIPPADRPAGVAHRTVPTRDEPLAALRAGARGGAAVVLVPGFTGSKEDFTPLLPLLAEAGFAATAIDQRGQFESPGARASDYSMDLFRDDLLDVLAGVGPAHVVGHSFGGQVARDATLARPELVRSLTLLDSGPAALSAPELGALRALVPVATLEQIWLIKEALDRENGVPLPPPDVGEFLHQRWLRNDPWSLSAIAHLLMTATDRTDELAVVARERGVPVLVMFGVDDVSAWTVDEQRVMARRLGVPAVSIPDAAHSPAVENPQRTAAELVAFVTSQHV